MKALNINIKVGDGLSIKIEIPYSGSDGVDKARLLTVLQIIEKELNKLKQK